MIHEFLDEFILIICISDWSKPSSPYRILLDILTQNLCITQPYTLQTNTEHHAKFTYALEASVFQVFDTCLHHAFHAAHERYTVLIF
jgi:hypothetical protein